MIKQAYVDGFMDKCAEYGVDPELLIKSAADSPLAEYGKALPGNFALGLLPGAGPAIAQIAGLGGEIKGYTDPDAEYGENSNWIPGQTQYNWSRRNKRVAREMLKKDPNSHPYANIVAERFGHATAPLASAGLGALIGGLAKGREGAMTGGAAGATAAGLAILIGAIRGLAKRRRTDEEQLSRETKGRAVAKWLVPGLAQEDAFMRLGKSRDYFQEGEKSGKKDSK